MCSAGYSYAYFLGSYLGDSSISAFPRTFRLCVPCDVAYPDIVESVHTAIKVIAPDVRVNRRPHRTSRCLYVEGYWKDWPRLVPQHGPGRKHDRQIVLEDWQQAIVDEHPWRFLAGLLRSDGCRTVNRFKTQLPSGRVAAYAYPRWFFSNRSADILGLFCATCDALGVRWTRSNHRNVSVAHRRSVALLDAHIGMKA
jgi:hypothetical protein